METVPEDAEGIHLVKNAAELVAATHVADGNEVGIDHAGPVHVQVRLADLAHYASCSVAPVHPCGAAD